VDAAKIGRVLRAIAWSGRTSAGTPDASPRCMAAILLLLGLPIAFSVTVLFLMTVTSHSVPPLATIALILGMASVLVGALFWGRRLENE
jgi:hypothetical protein